MDNHELISRCKAGEQEALHLLYEQYRPRLLSICRKYAKGENVAEDLLHDAFVVILTSLNQLRNDDKLESWMATIVRNVGYHYKMQLKKNQTALQQLAVDRQDAMTIGPMPDFNQLQKLVAQLPAGYQQVFRLSVFEGLSHQEIGSLLGIAPHTSSSQLSHAKRMLQILIRQSWVLMLLLIAIPLTVWKMLQKEEPNVVGDLKPVSGNLPLIPQGTQERPTLNPQTSNRRTSSAQPVRYQAEAVIVPDSIPSFIMEEQVDTLTEIAQVPKEQADTPTTRRPVLPTPQQINGQFSKRPNDLSPKSSAWNVQLAYNGQMGHRDNYTADAFVNQQSFASTSNSFIPTNYSFSNWIDYSWSLNNAFSTKDITEETRSLMEIAAQNSLMNHGKMIAQYTHQLPFNIQLTLSRQLSSCLSIETGLSYTQMKSTNVTGSSTAYIREEQRLRYLGIPLRIRWQWYSRAHLSLYSSAGGMLELPIRSTLNVKHISNNVMTFGKETTLDVSRQWSTSFGVGAQYDLTPNLGIYVEPSLQYFFDDGSNLKSYRTEHPLSISLPIGVRFHW